MKSYNHTGQLSLLPSSFDIIYENSLDTNHINYFKRVCLSLLNASAEGKRTDKPHEGESVGFEWEAF